MCNCTASCFGEQRDPGSVVSRCAELLEQGELVLGGGVIHFGVIKV